MCHLECEAAMQLGSEQESRAPYLMPLTHAPATEIRVALTSTSNLHFVPPPPTPTNQPLVPPFLNPFRIVLHASNACKGCREAQTTMHCSFKIGQKLAKVCRSQKVWIHAHCVLCSMF